MPTISTQQSRQSVFYSTNSTDTAALTTSRDSVTAKPSGDGVIALNRSDNISRVRFFGTDAANEAGEAQVWLWHGDNDYWEASLVGTFTLTLGAATGVSDKEVTSSDFFADTITASNQKADVVIHSQADDQIASVKFDNDGASFVEILFDIDTAASLNAIINTY